MERRALYNSLRMNWLLDPKEPVEIWQVEDYRSFTPEQLFQNLQDLGIALDKMQFQALSEQFDSPEELADYVANEKSEDQADKIYLIIFELWRRLIPEKQSFSVFCDELDHQIMLYDSGQTATVESLEDTLANLQVILDENVDSGANPRELFASVVNGCAQDVESFLYDFIQTQIEHQNYNYAQELIEGFRPYVKDEKWFELLEAEVRFPTDREVALQIMERLVRGKNKDSELSFNLEVLAFLSKSGEEKLFKTVIKHTLTVLEIEEDFLDLLHICSDFFHYLDQDEKEAKVQALIQNRAQIDSGTPFQDEDPLAKELLKIINS